MATGGGGKGDAVTAATASRHPAGASDSRSSWLIATPGSDPGPSAATVWQTPAIPAATANVTTTNKVTARKSCPLSPASSVRAPTTGSRYTWPNARWGQSPFSNANVSSAATNTGPRPK